MRRFLTILDDHIVRYTNAGSTINQAPDVAIQGRSAPTLLADINSSRLASFRFQNYMAAGIDAAGFNLTFDPAAPHDYGFPLVPVPELLNKATFTTLQAQLGLPTLVQYSPTRDTILAAPTAPIILKPVSGRSGYQPGMPFVYQIYDTPQALVAAIDAAAAWEQIATGYTAEEAVREPDGTSKKKRIIFMVNGTGVIRYLPVDVQTWQSIVSGNINTSTIADPATPIPTGIQDAAEKIVAALKLKNTWVHLQGMERDGVVYFNDADMRPPVLYAKLYNEFLVDHLKFIFDVQPDVTVMPTQVVAYKTLENLKGTPDTHLELLRNAARQLGTFFWIQRYYTEAEGRGAYLIQAQGTTEAAALANLQAFESYLT